ncbi:MAG: sulfotransferase domain-containing protein [Parachlamydiaceae bacterium]|nr:sulfotransferase domain-containing protein [Parachlamydiaceae bacterium]
MFKFYCNTRLFFLAIFFSLIVFSKIVYSNPKDFCLISMPKCGTHLGTKLLEMLTERKKMPSSVLNNHLNTLSDQQFALIIQNYNNQQAFIYGHTNPNAFGPFFLRYAYSQPGKIIFCSIRDLRDMLISFIFHKEKNIKDELGGEATFDQMLTQVLNPTQSFCGKLIQEEAQFCLQFFQLPNVCTLPFEELVGPKGGGNKKNQRQLIMKVARKLNLFLPQDELDYICNHLFGNDKKDEEANALPRAGTFRSGQIGSWKKYFKSEHHKLFREYWGSYQVAFGYTLE